MPDLDQYLKLNRCPHCSIDNPNLTERAGFFTDDDTGRNRRQWKTYACGRCGGVVTAYAMPDYKKVIKIYPDVESVNEDLPVKVKAYLQQAIDSTFAPAGSVMLSASAVDAMLKEKGYVDGSLYKRINEGVKDALLTKEMADWAHHVRLEANDQRHADVNGGLPTIEEAKQAIEFTKTLAEFLFVLPAKVTRGIASTTTPPTSPTTSTPQHMSGPIIIGSKP